MHSLGRHDKGFVDFGSYVIIVVGVVRQLVRLGISDVGMEGFQQLSGGLLAHIQIGWINLTFRKGQIMKIDKLFGRFILSAAGVAVSSSLLAVPSVDPASVTISQNQSTRLVTVQYKLTGDPAIVTIDFQTNNVGTWTSIGGEKYSQVIGDVNKLVNKIDEVSTIYWQPAKADAWPNQNIAGENFRAVVKVWATNAPPPYMIVDLKDNPGKTRYYPSAEAIPGGITNDMYKTNLLAFRLVPATLVTWKMGANSEFGQRYPNPDYGKSGQPEYLDYNDKENKHNVTFTNDYYMGVYPVTQMQHYLFSNQKPSASTNNFPDTAIYPVESVIWTKLRGEHYTTGKKGDWPTGGHELDAASILFKLRDKLNIPSLDLPTEAMWEYACRAGTSTATYAGNLTVETYNGEDPVLNRIAWYQANSGGHTHPVGMKEANQWGFYDMLGNVFEFVLDRTTTVMSKEDVIDPPGTTEGGQYPNRGVRGGSWNSIAYRVRAAYRAGEYGHAAGKNYVGYRLCCEAMALK